MSVTVFMEHTYNEIVNVKCAGFCNKFVVMSSAFEIVAVFSLWRQERV